MHADEAGGPGNQNHVAHINTFLNAAATPLPGCAGICANAPPGEQTARFGTWFVEYKTGNANSRLRMTSIGARGMEPRVLARRNSGTKEVAAETVALRNWLFGCALPLWWEVGADRARGGFHEAIDLDGSPLARPHRARTIARQAHCYCEAGRLGWNGPWRDAAQHALEYFRKYFIAPDDTVRSVVELDGSCRNPCFDLYDQGFALLAYASAHRAFGEAAGWSRAAAALRTSLQQNHAHPLGGFLQDREGRSPQCANPHMHLLEAALAWSALDGDPAWRRMADGLVSLCLEKMIEPVTGALRELFAADWTPAPGLAGRICEPGHHYEWAFLLERWAKLNGCARSHAAARLITFADARGLDPRRGVAVNAVLVDGAVHDPAARLWAQAERLRAYAAAGRDGDDVVNASKALRRFLATPTPGLWFDQLDERESFVLEPARATSLYHIMGAVDELSAAFPDPADAAGSARVTIGARPRVIYLVTEDWYFISHRLPMARAARDAGFEVHVATRVDRHAAAIQAEGFLLHPVSWRRGSLDPRDLLRVIREVRALYRKLKPDLAHHVALPATVVGSVAARGLPIQCVNAMTGLGTIFISNTMKVRAVRAALRPVLRWLLSGPGGKVLVQNLDDHALVQELGVEPRRIALIAGSGVDTDVMLPAPEPNGPVRVAFVGRLVEGKGIRALVEAHARLCAQGNDIKLVIAGVPDSANPSSIPAHEIAAWSRQRNVSYLGFVEDIAALWASVHVAALPSHREGLPLSLLEAAACGRPLIATDVPGCRDIARPDLNALLIPVDDVEALAAAIKRLALDPQLRRRFGAASRKLVEQEFSSKQIGRELVNIYRQMLDRAA
jgi:mannose/cellobiose epimerase-like protein (N-acyl-D-glucosamine 2-epimerase family)/glycosyltransferase involved in cell wall biosynthesis